MVRTKVAARARIACATGALLTMVSMAVSAVLQAQSPAPGTGLVDTLLQRAAATAAGTYAMKGSAIEPAAAPLPVLVQADVLRGPERTVRVPVVVGADLLQAAEIRLRVVSIATTGQAPRVMGNATGTGAAGPLRFVHEFALAPGEYEIQAVVGQSSAGAGATATLVKSRLTVPDVWAGALAVTPVVLGEDSGEARRNENRPFSFGPTSLIPAVQARFRQNGAIRVAFRVFNWSGKAGERPDLTAEYLFYEQGAKGFHFFNKVKPQQLTVATPGDSSDLTGGAATGGMLVPLSSFTFGDFQLRVSVTDNRNKQSAEGRVDFTVSP